MADIPVGPVLKRKRISVACNSCRAKKAKCDGHRPTCGRCAGYDFECTWGDQKRQQSNGPSQRSPSPSSHIGQESPSEVFVRHEQLVLKLSSDLPEAEQQELKRDLVSLKTSIFSALSVGKDANPTVSSGSSLFTTRRLETQKFVGEISDIHFLNLLTHLADPDGRANNSEGPVNSYDPDEATISDHLGDPAVDIPHKEEVERNLKTYFSTIHLAYPFVHKTVFMEKVERLRKEGPSPDLTHSWFALLCQYQSTYVHLRVTDRNMLAIKFHHLRTLIHRPYLCFPCLRGHTTEPLQPHHYIEGQQYSNTCVVEAQAIAHLMHNLSDTGDIVMNYPWWQMISCLVCAASVMILAECFNKQTRTDATTGSLDDDIGVCMEVLSALATNSTGAKLALDMLKTLQARSAQISEKLCPTAAEGHGQSRPSRQNCTDWSPPSQDSYSGGSGIISDLPVPAFDDTISSTTFAYGEANTNFGSAGIDDALIWSTVMPDSMNWPLEFLNMIEDPQSSSQHYPSS
ncbi:hypothetical protein LQW54_004302 [Pestalotiopsis sp. IQ-011]